MDFGDRGSWVSTPIRYGMENRDSMSVPKNKDNYKDKDKDLAKNNHKICSSMKNLTKSTKNKYIKSNKDIEKTTKIPQTMPITLKKFYSTNPNLLKAK